MNNRTIKSKIKVFLIRSKILGLIRYLLVPIIRLIKKIASRLSLVETRAACRSNTTNNNSFFLATAKVVNMQNNPEKIVIGQGTVILGELLIHPFGGKISIGDNCFIGEGTRIWSADDIHIGNNVMISHNVNMMDFSHKPNSLEREEEFKSMVKVGQPAEKGNIPTRKIVIEDNVIIYAAANIMMGVTIGKACIIAAGSVVIKDIPPYSLAIGNPAKVTWRTK